MRLCYPQLSSSPRPDDPSPPRLSRTLQHGTVHLAASRWSTATLRRRTARASSPRNRPLQAPSRPCSPGKARPTTSSEIKSSPLPESVRPPCSFNDLNKSRADELDILPTPGPEAFYPTQAPPTRPSAVVASTSKLKPRGSTSLKSTSSASQKRPRHNASASSSSSSSANPSTDLIIGDACSSKGNPAAPIVWDEHARSGDENNWNLAQILSEVDARMAARRRSTPAVAPVPTPHASAAPTKARNRPLSRSLSADRLPIGGSNARRNKSISRLGDVEEDRREEMGVASKRIKRSTSSGDPRLRSRSPEWDLLAGEGLKDWRMSTPSKMDRTSASSTSRSRPPSAPAPPHASTSRQPVLQESFGLQRRPTPLPEIRSPLVSPRKRTLPPSPLKPPATNCSGSDSQSTSVFRPNTQKQRGPARLGTRPSLSVSSMSNRGPARFRPPFKRPSPPASPPEQQQPAPASDTDRSMGEEDTSFDSFDGMFSALTGTAELEEVLRLVDGR